MRRQSGFLRFEVQTMTYRFDQACNGPNSPARSLDRRLKERLEEQDGSPFGSKYSIYGRFNRLGFFTFPRRSEIYGSSYLPCTCGSTYLPCKCDSAYLPLSTMAEPFDQVNNYLDSTARSLGIKWKERWGEQDRSTFNLKDSIHARQSRVHWQTPKGHLGMSNFSSLPPPPAPFVVKGEFSSPPAPPPEASTYGNPENKSVVVEARTGTDKDNINSNSKNNLILPSNKKFAKNLMIIFTISLVVLLGLLVYLVLVADHIV